MRINLFHQWLLVLSKPDGAVHLPENRLPARQWVNLIKIADYHGVLPAVAKRARYIMQDDGISCLLSGKEAQSGWEEGLGETRNRLLSRAGLSMAIRAQLLEITRAFKAAGVPATVLKGADFADYLYPDPSLRPFTDLDLLVSPEVVADAEAILARLGYTLQDIQMKYHSGYGEHSWRRANSFGGIVEIHWNLVNSPTIRRGVSLSWEDLDFGNDVDDRDGLPRPTAPFRLLIAAVHAATSHSFDRLQPLYDVCLASRSCNNEIAISRLSELVEKTGAILALTVALGLCCRLFDEPACLELQHALNLPQHGLWKVLLTPGVILRGHWQPDSFRRQLFREMLKKR